MPGEDDERPVVHGVRGTVCIGTRFIKFPRCLTLQLQRFKMNWCVVRLGMATTCAWVALEYGSGVGRIRELGTREKVCTPYSFPEMLDLKPYLYTAGGWTPTFRPISHTLSVKDWISHAL